MSERYVTQVLNSLQEGIIFEVGEEIDMGTRVSKGLIQAYQYIFNQGITIDMGEKEALMINTLVNQGRIPTLPPYFDFRSIYRSSNPRVTGMSNPPNYPMVPGLMNQLFYLASDESHLSPIEKAALCQGGVFGIQPFDDGNKRTGRVMSDKVLVRAGLNIPQFESREEYIVVLGDVFERIRGKTTKQENPDISDMRLYEPLIEKIRNHN